MAYARSVVADEPERLKIKAAAIPHVGDAVDPSGLYGGILSLCHRLELLGPILPRLRHRAPGRKHEEAVRGRVVFCIHGSTSAGIVQMPRDNLGPHLFSAKV
jgi:hypothetical protein